MKLRRNRSTLRKFLDIMLTVVGFAAIAWFIVWLENRNPNVLAGNARALDGDSLMINGENIRLLGVDAPEYNQTCLKSGERWQCGQSSRKALQRLVQGHVVTCRAQSLDVYDRWLAACTANGILINLRLVENGWAVNYGGYADAERKARAAKNGIWSSTFDRPRDWRKIHQGDVNPPGGVSGAFQATLAWLRGLLRRVSMYIEQKASML